MTPVITDIDVVKRLLLAAAIGGVVGAERELHGKSAGFRTNILIAMGAALFTIMSLTLNAERGDPARVVSQVVVGIGFIGAGAIMRTRGSVHGLTTAATVWVNAAIGIAAGAGEFHIAVIAGTITLVVLLILAPLEAMVERRLGKTPNGGRA